MAFSRESRLPFLTPELLQFAAGVPRAELLGPDGRGKWILREAMRGLVPDRSSNRRDKVGFDHRRPPGSADPDRGWCPCSRPTWPGVPALRTASGPAPGRRCRGWRKAVADPGVALAVHRPMARPCSRWSGHEGRHRGRSPTPVRQGCGARTGARGRRRRRGARAHRPAPRPRALAGLLRRARDRAAAALPRHPRRRPRRHDRSMLQ